MFVPFFFSVGRVWGVDGGLVVGGGGGGGGGGVVVKYILPDAYTRGRWPNSGNRWY